MSKQNELAQLADAVTVDGSGNLEVTGTVNAELVTVSSGVNTETRTFLVNNAHSGGSMYNALGVYVGETDRKITLSADYGDSIMAFKTNGSERMDINSSGQVTMGSSSHSDDVLYLTRSGTGKIQRFYSGSSEVGGISYNATPNLEINSQNGTFGIQTIGVQRYSFDQEQIYPWNNGECNLGLSYRRFDVVYAATGSINTSDQTQKQDIATLTATEMLVGKRLSALFKTFRWKNRVAEKGDSARTHTGIMAQEVQAAFTAEGLDASNYALFCSDTWWTHDVEVPAVEAVAEVTDENGNVTRDAVPAVDAYTRTDEYKTEDEAPEGAISKTLLGIRYPELLSFVAAYNEQRFASIEARLTALEA